MSVSVIKLDDGTPVTLVALPTYPGLAAVEFTGFDGIGFVKAPFSGLAQSQQWHGGDMWSGKATLPMMTQGNADNWLAFLEELRGMSYAFLMGDPLQPNIRGTGSGRPRVDNLAAGFNLPGSQTLATRGWTPNAVGVLLAGDYIQVGWRLYRALDDITAGADGKAVIPIWPALREQPFDDGTLGGWVNGSGSVGYTVSRPLGNNIAALMWSNFFFTSAPLPADAVIQGIYPTMLVSGTFDVAAQYLRYGYGVAYGDIFSGAPFPYFGTPSGGPDADFPTTILTIPSLGVDLSVLANFDMQVLLNTTLDVPFPPATTPSLTAQMTVTEIGAAIYYTSATPDIDPQMTPPFAVPAGQGVAFSLPLTVAQQGSFGGGGGIFDPSTGHSIGVGAVHNGLLTLFDTKNLWRLATNKRDWTTEFQRLTAPSFPFQEYR